MSGADATEGSSVDLDELIDRLLVTRAGAGYDRMRGEALAALLEAGEDGHRAIVDRMASEGPSRRLIRVLPMFELDETIPVLTDVLYSDDADATLQAAAADALADMQRIRPEAPPSQASAEDVPGDGTVTD